MANTPTYAIITFFLCTAYTAFCFYKASNDSRQSIAVILGILVIQGILGYNHFYLNFDTAPPRFPLVLAPTICIIIILFLTNRGKQFLDKFQLKWLTLLHLVRIPVEICLFWLFVAKLIPQEMTFEGRNFDILAGITAIFVYLLYFVKRKMSDRALIIWNLVFAGFLINIILHAIFALPTGIQQIGFEQPNVGVLYLPFIFLPCFVAPCALLSHFIAIRLLLKRRKS